jgi:hypothetical protein
MSEEKPKRTKAEIKWRERGAPRPRTAFRRHPKKVRAFSSTVAVLRPPGG